ncbi:PREDICTED: non-specific lipid-transfer protein-like protein At2g13820 isoform X2 [Ipomoea nil]|uniref:non-specific lipid-transfer protein-like protein At2g13820 isoform X2 n=1 Tax=Ipomoea nil TaxID=35883 RepID=UPI000900C2B4|nr:PREDICTED: non-specific lipid-transfer protein-like protein At2g13820 isoform X2 [Ipomoea nil]
MAFPGMISALLLAISLALPLNAQINSPCTASMLTSFTPCLNFITNSSPTGGSPSSDCCNIMKSVMGNGVGCLCFIAAGGIPFQVPINRNLTLSLPRACQTPGVSVQCKASGTPTAASSPAAAVSPAPGPSRGPGGDDVQKPLSPSLAPESDAPPSPTTVSETPATNTGSRVSPTPSAAPSRCPSPLLMVAVLGGALVFKLY